MGLGEAGGWAVGRAGLVYDLANRASSRVGAFDLTGIDGPAADDLWIVGSSGTVLRSRPGGWEPVPGPSADLTAVAVTGAGTFVGTSTGEIWRLSR